LFVVTFCKYLINLLTTLNSVSHHVTTYVFGVIFLIEQLFAWIALATASLCRRNIMDLFCELGMALLLLLLVFNLKRFDEYWALFPDV
jgi:hypothetical protein